MANESEIKEALSYIDPATCSYQEWCQVGMAIKAAGLGADLFDEWSQRDPDRYHHGEAKKKFDSFNDVGITPKTLFGMAYEAGMPKHFSSDEPARALELDDVISDTGIIDQTWIEREDIKEPITEEWEPLDDLRRYLKALFKENEFVGMVVPAPSQHPDKDDKYKPINAGSYGQTAGQLIHEIDKAKSKNQGIDYVIGDYNKAAGAWIRFNPLDGKGVKNANVTAYRYALVESDEMDLGMQAAVYRKLELPIAAMVYSGSKSVHAIVHIDAPDLEEYKKRVEYLYKICKKNGLIIDIQNKNPSRLSRLPGVFRGDHKQFLIDTNIGKSSWAEWEDYIDQISDDLPDPENLATDWQNLPELSPPLIDGILRQGHKMLLAGPSKAGKSFALIELTIAIAEGAKWFGQWQCAQGRVLYINLELDRASCLHRFKDVYDALGIRFPHLGNIDIWNLRGHAVPMDKLTPKLIRRSEKKGYIAVIIDPIYKVITGDENSAEQMSKFCTQFDTIATALNCAVIYCHHHSKGAQGGKRAMDRASGSGVFARDPDAMIDMTELPIDDDVMPRVEGIEICKTIADEIRGIDPHFFDTNPENVDVRTMRGYGWKVLRKKYNDNQIDALTAKAAEKAHLLTAWRISFTLREFASPAPTDIWFDYPKHYQDTTGLLKDLMPDEELAPWQKAVKKHSSDKSKKKRESKRQNELEVAFSNLELNGDPVTYQMLADAMNVSVKTVQRRVKEAGDSFKIIQEDGKETVIERSDKNM